MPRFILEAKYDDETEAILFGRELSLEDRAFETAFMDVEDELFLAKDSLARIKTITAAEDINDNVRAGDVVWRNWIDCDLTNVDGRMRTIELALGYKALWRDMGIGFDFITEVLCPDEGTIEYYGLKPEDGYVFPER